MMIAMIIMIVMMIILVIMMTKITKKHTNIMTNFRDFYLMKKGQKIQALLGNDRKETTFSTDTFPCIAVLCEVLAQHQTLER